MIIRTIGRLASMIPGARLVNGEPDKLVRGVSKDTRTMPQGVLYVPIIGPNFDGHDFVAEAMSKGAAASLWQEDHPLPDADYPLIVVDNVLQALQKLANVYRNELPVRVIGITGSNGKTTTKDMVATLLGTTYKVQKTEGNLNTEIGLPLTLLEMDENTEVAVLEMGMRGRGQIEELTLIAEPDVAIITVIGESHLELLGSREEIARAKTEILAGLKEGGLFVYNGDEPLFKQVLPEMPKPARMDSCRFGAETDNDLYPLTITPEADGTRFTINSDPAQSCFIPLLGRHNVINALSAIAAARHLGVAESDIVEGLRNVKLSGMRIEVLRTKQGLTLVNDTYNASPTSTRAALQLLQELQGYTRKMIVLGDMLELGENEVRYHRDIGALLVPEVIDYVYTYGRLAKEIAETAAASYPPGRVKAFDDKQLLIEMLSSEAKRGDVILFKASRGMKLEEVISHLMD